MKQSRWTYTEWNDQITIKRRSGHGARIIVPSRIDEYPVTHIRWDAFRSDAAIAEVRLSRGLLATSGRAFEDCVALGSLNIPVSVKKIGRFAFSACAGLKSFAIPRGLHYTVREKHLTRTFEEDCATLSRLEKTTRMGIAPFLFAGCAGLEDLAIFEGLAAAGGGAFCGCGRLSEKQREKIGAYFWLR